MRKNLLISIAIISLFGSSSFAATKPKPAKKATVSKPVVINRVPSISNPIASNQDTQNVLPNPDQNLDEPIAIETKKTPPPPVNLMSGKNAKLTNNEQHAISIANGYIKNDIMPQKGEEGVVIFPFGAVMPSVVCAPLMVCDIALETGEVVNDINVGDAVRWKLSPATSGAGMTTTTHVIVKPTDSALTTNAIITTNRRVYTLKLVSRKSDFMPRVAFSYPQQDMQNEWADYRTRMSGGNAPIGNSQGTTGKLNFDYKIAGDKPKWTPTRVYRDDYKTYIEFPKAIEVTEAPALLVLDNGNSAQLVNYRVDGNRYVVDKIFDKAELVAGAGKKQVKVTITRKGDL